MSIEMWPAPTWSFRRLSGCAPVGLHTYCKDGKHFGSIYVHKGGTYVVQGISVHERVTKLKTAKRMIEDAYMGFWGFVSRKV